MCGLKYAVYLQTLEIVQDYSALQEFTNLANRVQLCPSETQSVLVLGMSLSSLCLWAGREVKNREVPLTHHLHHSLRPVLSDRRRVICLLPALAPKICHTSSPLHPLLLPDSQAPPDVTLIVC
ncbi:hypothetical protein E2C01_024338 [Portunus trituberculatus]|uniref:Uncharacterized protein n=1 Tax=Portunus trituberculatus TaxID=210409 RepID=A0A5B7EA35_PORTR|nr:hypothetical protein [Portunus trituberculatus]